MKLAREGYPFVAFGLTLAGLTWFAVLRGSGGVLLYGMAGAATALALFVVWFFRDPQPAVPSEEDLVVAPGQGKVIAIDTVEEPTFMGGEARRVSIFLSVFDVHVQRAPVSGTVSYKKYSPGTYALAWLDKASEDNEQASLGIETDHGRLLMRQIAGLVARRIVTDPNEGDVVQRGRRVGLIRFGSRVDVFLPLHWEVVCGVGDKVRVGSSVLARQRPETT